MRNRITVAALAFFTLAALAAQAAGPGADFDTVDLVRRTPGCKDAGDKCAEIKVSYPKITAGPPAAARDAINGHIIKTVLEGFDSEGRAPTIEANMEKFLADHQAALADNPDFAIGWYLEITCTVVLTGPTILALQHSINGFTGGAHPFYSTVYYNFDLQTGKVIPLAALLAPGGKAKLDRIAEKKFRAQKQLSPTARLDEAGWSFEGNQFALNDNFFISASGLTFYFNPYEIGPYVLGSTSLELAYAEIAGALDMNGPLGPMLQAPEAAVPDLCAEPSETTLFSCQTDGKKPKVLSLCATQPGGQSFLYYRFGTTDRVELSYPGEGKEIPPGQAFQYRMDPEDKAGAIELGFENGGYSYRVRQDADSHGVKVFFPDGNKTVTIMCREPVRGSLGDLAPLFK